MLGISYSTTFVKTSEAVLHDKYYMRDTFFVTHVIHFLLNKFDKFSTTAVVCFSIRQVHREDKLMAAHAVDSFENSGMETEAVKIRQGMDVLQALKKRLVFRP